MAYKLYEHLSSTLVGPQRRPEFIVIHWYGTPGQTGNVHGTAQYLAGATHASVNYVTADGVVYCLVSPQFAAYAQGDGANGRGNIYGISIENNPWCTPGDRETSAELIANIRAEWGMLPLRIHKEFTNTQCPGVWADWIGWLDTRSRQILAERNGQPAPAPSPAPIPKPIIAPAGNTAVNGLFNMTVTQNPAWIRTAPRASAPLASGYPNGIAGGAVLAIQGYVKGDDPFPADAVQDDAWLKTKSGFYVWANAVGNNIAGLPMLGDMSTKAPAPAPAPAPTPVKHSRIVTNPVAWVRTSPESTAPAVAAYPNGIAKNAVITVLGFVAGQDPYQTGDNAWYKTPSGYVWANAAQNDLSGLAKLN